MAISMDYGVGYVGNIDNISLENIDVSDNEVLECRKKSFVSFIKDIQKELVIKENDQFYKILFDRGLDLFFKQNKKTDESAKVSFKDMQSILKSDFINGGK